MDVDGKLERVSRTWQCTTTLSTFGSYRSLVAAYTFFHFHCHTSSPEAYFLMCVSGVQDNEIGIRVWILLPCILVDSSGLQLASQREFFFFLIARYLERTFNASLRRQQARSICDTGTEVSKIIAYLKTHNNVFFDASPIPLCSIIN